MVFELQRIERIIKDLKAYIYPDSEPVTQYRKCDENISGGENRPTNNDSWNDFKTGELWGGYDKHSWFRTTVKIPERFEGKDVIFRITTGREGQWDALNPQFLLYIDGKLIQGLDVNHREVLIARNAKANSEYSIALLGYSGLHKDKILLITELCVLDSEIEDLYYNINVPHSVAKLLGKEDDNTTKILLTLGNAIDMLDLRKIYSEDFYKSVSQSNEYLKKIFYTDINYNCPTVTAVGHTHIDIAWLWRICQTKEKTVRSFSTVLNLMKEYPEYKFMSSQPQLYEYIKELEPTMYEEIKQRIKEERWEADGAMWLEADCNLPSGESLVRQILFGTRFFKEELGVDCKSLWLPDVFGYSAALPQILKKSGIKYFVTTKISWSQFNTVPNDTFMWRGIDGSEIFTYFVTTSDYDKYTGDKITFSGKMNTTTYTGTINANQVLGTWKRYQNKDINDETMMLYGYGDGGGGPTKEMLENAKRLKYGIPGCPRLQTGLDGDFLDRLHDRLIESGAEIPKWVGELYLEYHRGTYTSMAENKRYNRKSEFLHLDAELLSTMAMLLGENYPASELNKGWKGILLNQFHDIIPGSSIKEVYEDSREHYEEIISSVNGILNEALTKIASKIDLKNKSIVVFNTLSFDRDDIVEFSIPDGVHINGLKDCNGNNIDFQVSDKGKKLVFFAEGVPSKGYKVFYIADEKNEITASSKSSTIGDKKFENEFFKIDFDDDYNIISMYDKCSDRQLIDTGKKANVIQAFEDRPMQWENWDIDIYYNKKMWEVNDLQSVEIVEQGPIRYCIKVEREFCSSKITQYIYFYSMISRVDFKTVIDWNEKNILLKAAFPVNINASRATYEIQYGNIERETHNNTSWDLAKFEVCGHKWADISEGAYGISLMNDCKYGYDIKDNLMRLTLLKSGTYPNPDADLGIHEFTYSLYPHSGTWKEAGTQKMAYNINVPMHAVVENSHKGALPEALALFNVDKENCIIEVVKKAEDGNGVIVRLYEYMNKRDKITITAGMDINNVWECDLMENKVENVKANDRNFTFDIKPYEIKTFLIDLNNKN